MKAAVLKMTFANVEISSAAFFSLLLAAATELSSENDFSVLEIFNENILLSLKANFSRVASTQRN